MCVCVCVCCVCVCKHVYIRIHTCELLHLQLAIVASCAAHHQTHASQLSAECSDLEQQLQRVQSLVDKISSYEQQLHEAHEEMSLFKQQMNEKISQMEVDHQNELEVCTQICQ